MIHLPSEKRSFAPRKLMICYFLMTIQRYKINARCANVETTNHHFSRVFFRGKMRENIYRFSVWKRQEETPALMTDLVNWYNDAEASGKYSAVELAALFHYRYIRIHPFEDGNGRIARLMVNYILARHGWPMIVVRSRKKQEYLEALHKADIVVGLVPSDGAHASLTKIRKFVTYFTKLVENELAYTIAYIENKDDNVWWYDGEKIAFRSSNYSKILRLLKEDPYLTFAKLSEELGINVSATQKLIEKMLEKGYIQRRDSDKSWYVLASSVIK